MKKLAKNIFFSFYLKNQICGYCHHHIRNQRLKIRGYSEFQIIWNYVEMTSYTFILNLIQIYLTV